MSGTDVRSPRAAGVTRRCRELGALTPLTRPRGCWHNPANARARGPWWCRLLEAVTGLIFALRFPALLSFRGRGALPIWPHTNQRLFPLAVASEPHLLFAWSQPGVHEAAAASVFTLKPTEGWEGSSSLLPAGVTPKLWTPGAGGGQRSCLLWQERACPRGRGCTVAPGHLCSPSGPICTGLFGGPWAQQGVPVPAGTHTPRRGDARRCAAVGCEPPLTSVPLPFSLCFPAWGRSLTSRPK